MSYKMLVIEGQNKLTSGPPKFLNRKLQQESEGDNGNQQVHPLLQRLWIDKDIPYDAQLCSGLVVRIPILKSFLTEDYQHLSSIPTNNKYSVPTSSKKVVQKEAWTSKCFRSTLENVIENVCTVTNRKSLVFLILTWMFSSDSSRIRTSSFPDPSKLQKTLMKKKHSITFCFIERPNQWKLYFGENGKLPTDMVSY